MNSSHLPVRFSMDKDRTLDTMEAVLAIARRGGLTLGKLQMHSAAKVDQVELLLLANASESLDLFMARISNLVDILDLESGAIANQHYA